MRNKQTVSANMDAHKNEGGPEDHQKLHRQTQDVTSAMNQLHTPADATFNSPEPETFTPNVWVANSMAANYRFLGDVYSPQSGTINYPYPPQQQQQAANYRFLDHVYSPQSATRNDPYSQQPAANYGFLDDIYHSQPPPPPQAPSANQSFFSHVGTTSENVLPQKRQRLPEESHSLEQQINFQDLSDGFQNWGAGNVHFLNGLQLPPTNNYWQGSGLSSSSKTTDLSLSQGFIYDGLPKDIIGTIRLIRLDSTPALEHGELDYTITAFCPSQSNSSQIPTAGLPEYHCLSYCWGENTKTRHIRLRSSSRVGDSYNSLPVTHNLFSALKSLARTHPEDWLWIDAISINQNDHEERSAQVSIMKRIYDQAVGVVIWLGESEAASHAYPLICAISSDFAAKTEIQASEIVGVEGLKLNGDHLALLEQYTKGNVADKAPLDAYEELANFFSLPWFRRVWVLQEAFSHTKVVARMGAMSVPWGSIILAALWQSFLARHYTAKSDKISRRAPEPGEGFLPELWLGLLHSRIPRGLGIVELVCRARDFQASDPRDKVFGLLGLANDINANSKLLSLRPDYTRSKMDVYRGFAIDIIYQTGTLEVLSAVNTFTDQSRQPDSCSWMPNLDHPLATIRGLGFPPKYNAAFSTKVPSEARITSDGDITQLALVGFFLDTVSENISGLLTLKKDLRLYHDLSPYAIEGLYLDFVTPHYDPDSESTLVAFIYTLTATGFALPTQFPAHPLGKVVPPQSPEAAQSLASDFVAYMHKNPPITQFKIPMITGKYAPTVKGDADQFAVLAGKACHERKFFITQEGRMGLCPRNAREGDKIVILYGGSVPYVLREMEAGRWSFVGECYVDGYMFGEAEKVRGFGGKAERVFHIV